MVVLGGGADHPCAPVDAELHRDAPDAAGGSVHQQHVAGADVQPVEGALRGQAGQRQPPGLRPVQAAGLAGHRRRGHGDVLRERPGVHAVLAGVGHHLVPDRELGGVRAGRDDHPGHVPAGDDREHGVHHPVEPAGHHLPVHRVHPGGPDLDQHLPGADLGVGDLAVAQPGVVGGEGVVRYRAHAGTSWWAAGPVGPVGPSGSGQSPTDSAVTVAVSRPPGVS